MKKPIKCTACDSIVDPKNRVQRYHKICGSCWTNTIIIRSKEREEKEFALIRSHDKEEKKKQQIAKKLKEIIKMRNSANICGGGTL